MFGNIVVIPRNWLLLFQKSQTRSGKEGLLELEFRSATRNPNIGYYSSGSKFKKSGRPCKLDEKRARLILYPKKPD